MSKVTEFFTFIVWLLLCLAALSFEASFIISIIEEEKLTTAGWAALSGTITLILAVDIFILLGINGKLDD